MRILLTNSLVLNTGDATTVEGMIRTLRDSFGHDTQFEVVDANPREAGCYYPALRFAEWPLPVFARPRRTSAGSTARRRASGWRAYLAAWCFGRRLGLLTRLFLRPEEHRLLTRYAGSDLIASTGGTYLVEHYDLAPHLFDYRICRLMRRPLVLWTQSLGPFTSDRVRRSLRRDLSSALVLLRDRRSFEHLRAAGIHPARTHVCADAAFALAEASTIADARSERRNGRPMRVAISVRYWDHFDSADTESGMNRYLAAIRALTERLVVRHGAEVTFLSTCQGVPEYRLDDSAVADGVARDLPRDIRRRVAVDRAFRSADGLLEELQRYDMVVATRMHFAILSLSAGVPVLPIAYEFKTRELFRRLGMEQMVLDIETVNEARAVDLLERFIEGLPQSREGLFRRVDAERRSAIATGEIVRRWLDEASAP